MKPSTQQHPQDVIYNPYIEDEISLVDLWLVIRKRRALILYSVIFFTLTSLLFALTKADKYQYKTTIEIGVRVADGGFKRIESPDTALAKLNESYIPLVLTEYVKNSDPEHKNKLEIKARIPKNSEIIVLELKGRDDQQVLYFQLLEQVVNKIKDNHKKITSLIRKNMDVESNKLANQNLAYEDEINLLRAKLLRQDKVVTLIKQEIIDADKILKSALKNKQKALREAKDETKALTLMLLNSEIRKAQEDSASLKERLYVQIAEIKDDLNKKIKDIERRMLAVKDEQSQLILEKESIKETDSLTPPIRSLNKVGVSKSIIVIIGILLGVIVGFSFAFLKEFSVKVKEKEAEDIFDASSEKG